ncbi:DUF3857 domain-containing protein, partial [Salinivirga cyanobacteriivorans]
KKDGYDWANFREEAERKSYIKGVTYNLVDGKVSKDKLRNRDIYEEEVVDDEYSRYRFTMPNVKVGSVIDVSYSRTGLPSEFRFQEEIPVHYAELILPQSQYITYKKHFYGKQSVLPKSSIEWAAREVPAFREEPYMNHKDNYITRFSFEITNISFPGYMYHNYASDWPNVSGNLMGHSEFGERLRSSCFFLNSVVKDIEEKYTDDFEKVKAAHEHVKNHMTWNDRKRLYADYDLRYIYNEGSGNTGEINLILIKLLQKLDLKAFPIVLSSRDNGMLNPLFASLDQLNYVVAGVSFDERNYILDATDKLLPVGLLPKHAYNGKGRYIEEKVTGWFDIEAPKHKFSTTYDLKMHTNGDFSGNLSKTFYGTAAYDFRQTIEDYGGMKDYLKDYTSQNPGVEILDYEIKNLENIYADIELNLEVAIKGKTNVVGSDYYFNPFFYSRIEKNPFQSEERKFPIDFVYPLEHNYFITLSFPEGYKVAQVPESDIARLPQKGGQYFFNVSNLWQKIQISYQHKQSASNYTNAFYPYLKELYRRIVKKQAEYVIVKKQDNE